MNRSEPATGPPSHCDRIAPSELPLHEEGIVFSGTCVGSTLAHPLRIHS
jgi:hypothetical protein